MSHGFRKWFYGVVYGGFLCLFLAQKNIKKMGFKVQPPPPLLSSGTHLPTLRKIPRNAWDSCGWWCNHSGRWHKVVRRISTSRNSPPWGASGWLPRGPGPGHPKTGINELTWGAPTACWTPWIYLWGWVLRCWRLLSDMHPIYRVQKTSISSCQPVGNLHTDMIYSRWLQFKHQKKTVPFS